MCGCIHCPGLKCVVRNRLKDVRGRENGERGCEY